MREFSAHREGTYTVQQDIREQRTLGVMSQLKQRSRKRLDSYPYAYLTEIAEGVLLERMSDSAQKRKVVTYSTQSGG